MFAIFRRHTFISSLVTLYRELWVTTRPCKANTVWSAALIHPTLKSWRFCTKQLSTASRPTDTLMFLMGDVKDGSRSWLFCVSELTRKKEEKSFIKKGFESHWHTKRGWTSFINSNWDLNCFKLKQKKRCFCSVNYLYSFVSRADLSHKKKGERICSVFRPPLLKFCLIGIWAINLTFENKMGRSDKHNDSSAMLSRRLFNDFVVWKKLKSF